MNVKTYPVLHICQFNDTKKINGINLEKENNFSNNKNNDTNNKKENHPKSYVHPSEKWQPYNEKKLILLKKKNLKVL